MPDELSATSIQSAMSGQLERLAWGMHAALNEHEFPAAQEYCPKDTEELVRTAYLGDPVKVSDGYEITISFGNAESGDTGIYAIVQHEDTTLNHPHGGIAKYLETAVIEGQPTIMERSAQQAGKL